MGTGTERGQGRPLVTGRGRRGRAPAPGRPGAGARLTSRGARLFWTLSSRNWDDVLEDPVAAAHVDALADRVVAATPPGALVVDLGCGTGNHVAALVARGRSALGLDVTPAMLAKAAGKVSGATAAVGWVRCDLERGVALAGGSVDAVLSVYAVQFLDAPAFLAEVRRVLRPGGVAVIEAPRPAPPGRDVRHLSRRYRWFRQVKQVAARVGTATGAVRALESEELVAAVTAAGLVVSDVDTTAHSTIVTGRRTGP